MSQKNLRMNDEEPNSSFMWRNSLSNHIQNGKSAESTASALTLVAVFLQAAQPGL